MLRRLLQGSSAISICIMMIAGAHPAAAFESDAISHVMADIEDSSPDLDLFINEMAIESLAKTNGRKKPVSCPVAAQKIFKHIFSSIIGARVKKFYKRKRAPKIFHIGKKSGRKALAQSYLRFIPTIYITGLSGTINLNGVHMGTDKMGHFFGRGRRYFKRYNELIEQQGLSSEEATLKVIRRGIKAENGIIGKKGDGIFAYADLEANFQGFLMLKSMCETPYLRRQQDQWVLMKPLSIVPFVNPGFDEMYNNSHFSKPVWPLINRAIGPYCHIVGNAEWQERKQWYASIDEPLSLSRLFVEDYLRGRGKYRQDKHSFENACKVWRKRRARRAR